MHCVPISLFTFYLTVSYATDCKRAVKAAQTQGFNFQRLRTVHSLLDQRANLPPTAVGTLPQDTTDSAQPGPGAGPGGSPHNAWYTIATFLGQNHCFSSNFSFTPLCLTLFAATHTNVTATAQPSRQVTSDWLRGSPGF